MPVVIVETWSAKSDEQKATLIKGITKVFEQIGVTADQVQVIIHDVQKTNWGMRGEPASKLPPWPRTLLFSSTPSSTNRRKLRLSGSFTCACGFSGFLGAACAKPINIRFTENCHCRHMCGPVV